MNIKDALTQQVERWTRLGHTPLLDTFILRNGHVGNGQARPRGTKKLRAKACFANASRFIVAHDNASGLPFYNYVEGYAVNPDIGMFIHHAWVEDLDHNVIDQTWDDPEKCFYFGVTFTPKELIAELVKNQYYGLLDTGVGLNVDLMTARDPGIRDVLDKAMAA